MTMLPVRAATQADIPSLAALRADFLAELGYAFDPAMCRRETAAFCADIWGSPSTAWWPRSRAG